MVCSNNSDPAFAAATGLPMVTRTRPLLAMCILFALTVVLSPWGGLTGPLPVAAAKGEATMLGFSDLYSGASVMGLVFSEKLKRLDGQRVVMSGFMAPPLKPDLDFFVLTKAPMALCPFCSSDADWPSDIVVVIMGNNRLVKPTEKPIRVEGRLEVGSKVDEQTGFVSLIRIIADDVRVLKPGESLSASAAGASMALLKTPPVGPWVGEKAPPISGEDLDGGSISLAFDGSTYYVINFWATWCPSCRGEMLELEKIHRAWHDPGAPEVVRVIGVNVKESRDAVARFVRKTGTTYPILIDSGTIVMQYRLRGLPATFIVDPDGIIVSRITGPVTAAGLCTHLKQAGTDAVICSRA